MRLWTSSANESLQRLRETGDGGAGRDALLGGVAAADYFLKGISRGSVVTGTVSSVHNFGVFVHLDGEPDVNDPLGFIRIPEISWTHFSDVAEVIAVGDRVRGEVLDVDPERRQVYVSLKALRPGPAPGRLDANG